MSSAIGRRLSMPLLATTLICLAWQSAAEVSARQTGPAAATPSLTVSGRAVDEDRRALGSIVATLFPALDPYRRARIELGLEEPPESVASTTTDIKGTFRLGAPAAGIYVLELADAELSSGGHLERRTLLVVEDLELGSVSLRPARAIQVKVSTPQGTPLSGARIGSGGGNDRGREPPKLLRTITDDRGAATLLVEDTEGRGPVEVVISAPGHAIARRTVRTDRLEVTLEPGSPRLLRVLDPDSRPATGTVLLVAGIAVGATGPEGTIGLRIENGALELDLLSPDLATAHALLRGSRELPEPAGANDPSASAETPKPDEARTELHEHTVRLVAATSIEGTVVEKEGGGPIAGAFVATVIRDQLARSDAKGAFTISMPVSRSGPFALEARSPDHGPAFWSSRPVEGTRVKARLEMERARLVAGTVADIEGRPVAGAEVVEGPWRANSRGGARTDEGGRFQLQVALGGVSPSLEISHPEFATLRHELTALELEAGSVRLVLDAGRTAVGWVIDSGGRQLEGARVELTAFATSNQPPWQAPRVDEHAGTDAEGRFAFARVAPGRYSLLVEREGFAPAAVPGVEVSADVAETELGTITLGPGAAIEGVVLTPERAPLEGVELWLGGRQVPEQSATSDSEGRFAIRDLPPGTDQMLRVTLEGWVAIQRNVTARLDGTPIEIVMQPGLRLTGLVVDGTTESEIADARVTLQPQDQSSRFELPGAFQSTRTAVDGTFELDDLPASTYRLSVQADEYQPTAVESLELRTAEQREPMRVELRPGVVVTGRVLDGDGEPLTEARVERRDERDRNSSFRPFQMRGTATDAEGRYRLDGLPAGSVVLVAHARERSSRVRELVLEPGDNEVDFVLEPAPVLAGRVVDQQGQPVAGAQVSQRSGNSGNSDESDANGRFRIPVELGAALRVQASKPGAGTSEVLEIEVGIAPLPEVELQLRRGTLLRGRVEGLDVDALARANVSARLAGTVSRQLSWIRPDFEGRFQIEDLLPGRWSISANSQSRSVQQSIVVEPDVAEIEVTLRFEEGASLTGTVVSAGEPVADARLGATGLDVAGQASARTDSAGTFLFEDLALGRYDLRIEAPGRTLTHSEEVEVRGDEQVTIELPELGLVGRVLSGDGGPPLVGARVVLQAPERSIRDLWPGSGAEHTTDGEGRFRVAGLNVGTYTFEASHPDHATRVGQVEIRDDSSEELTIELERASGLVLRVTGPLGIPAARVEISVRGPDGKTLMTRYYAAGENGRIDARDLPAGRHLLLVTDQNALAELEAEVPGDEIAVQLERGGFLEVSAPELAGSGFYRIEVERASGPTRAWANSPPLRGGFARIGPLPSGAWTVRVSVNDRELAATAVVEPGRTVPVELR